MRDSSVNPRRSSSAPVNPMKSDDLIRNETITACFLRSIYETATKTGSFEEELFDKPLHLSSIGHSERWLFYHLERKIDASDSITEHTMKKKTTLSLSNSCNIPREPGQLGTTHLTFPVFGPSSRGVGVCKQNGGANLSRKASRSPALEFKRQISL